MLILSVLLLLRSPVYKQGCPRRQYRDNEIEVNQVFRMKCHSLSLAMIKLKIQSNIAAINPETATARFVTPAKNGTNIPAKATWATLATIKESRSQKALLNEITSSLYHVRHFSKVQRP